VNYLYLIKQLFTYTIYLKYRHHIKIEKDQREIYYLFKALDQLMEKFQKDISFEDYALWVQVNLGNDYTQYIQLLKETNQDETILEASLNEIKTRSVLYELASAALAGSEGKQTVEQVLCVVEKLTQTESNLYIIYFNLTCVNTNAFHPSKIKDYGCTGMGEQLASW